MAVFVINQLVITQDIGIYDTGLVHIGHTNHTAQHAAKLLTLIKQQVIILHGLEPVAFRVCDIESLAAIGGGHYGTHLIPALRCILVRTLGIAAFDLGAEDTQVTHLNLEIHRLGLTLRVLPKLKSAATLQTYCNGCMTLARMASCIWKHTLSHSIILQYTYIYSKYLNEPFP